MPDFSFEKKAGGIVCGVDEAGRGPWAGPVVAAAVVLPLGGLPDVLLEKLDDSKKLKRPAREFLFELITGLPGIYHGVGIAGVPEIDATNILRATHCAMKRAVDGLGITPDMALVDGNQPPALSCPLQCIVGGDGLSLSIAAASIVAKVTRDKIMTGLAEVYPGFGWDHNAGYGTAKHRDALERLGVTPHHRKSFKPIRNMLVKKSV